jgi:hypothetical protein
VLARSCGKNYNSLVGQQGKAHLCPQADPYIFTYKHFAYGYRRQPSIFGRGSDAPGGSSCAGGMGLFLLFCGKNILSSPGTKTLFIEAEDIF